MNLKQIVAITKTVAIQVQIKMSWFVMKAPSPLPFLKDSTSSAFGSFGADCKGGLRVFMGPLLSSQSIVMETYLVKKVVQMFALLGPQGPQHENPVTALLQSITGGPSGQVCSEDENILLSSNRFI